MKPLPILVCASIVLAGILAPHNATGAVYCQASFDDKLVDEAIGTGGPDVGEPVSTHWAVDAIVRGGIMPSPALQISDQSTSSSGSVRFEFAGGVEVTSGFVVVEADFWFESYENYHLYVREQGSASQVFTTLNFSQFGEVFYDDANSAGGLIGTYETGRHFPVKINFNMDAGIYYVILDDVLVLSAESHGITSRGVGAVLFGNSYDADLDGSFCIDHLFIGDYLPPATYLEANFNYKTIGSPIGLGGAEFGEPYYQSLSVATTVRDDILFTPSLEIQDIDNYAAGGASFHLLGDEEIDSGMLIVAAEIWMSEIDEYYFRVREHSSSVHKFSDLEIFDGGYLLCEDVTGMSDWYAFYDPGRVYDIMFVHNINTGTYDFWFDGERVIDDRPHGVIGAGIGKIIAGCSNDEDLDGALHIDNLYVGTSWPEDRLVCCADEDCGVVIPMDCAFHAGDLHPEWDDCMPNYCAPADLAEDGHGPSNCLLKVTPNPAGENVTLHFQLAQSAGGDLTIHDVGGRLLRRLPCSPAAVEWGTVVWDRRLEDGSRAAPGVYFARLGFGDGETVQRLIILE
jgi:hypothetical protein